MVLYFSSATRASWSNDGRVGLSCSIMAATRARMPNSSTSAKCAMTSCTDHLLAAGRVIISRREKGETSTLSFCGVVARISRTDFSMIQSSRAESAHLAQLVAKLVSREKLALQFTITQMNLDGLQFLNERIQ